MAFAPFEWMLAVRYLRARRQEGFISVIAGFSLLGIALGVATLIIVMSVMNGFRAELLGRILGLNGHLTVQGQQRVMTDFDALAGKIKVIEGVVHVTPLVEGQVMVTANGVAGARRHLLGGEAQECCKRYDGDDRQEEDQRLRLRDERLGQQRCGNGQQQPQDLVVTDCREQIAQWSCLP